MKHKKEVKILLGFVPIKLNPERPTDIKFNYLGVNFNDVDYYLSKREFYRPSFVDKNMLQAC